MTTVPFPSKEPQKVPSWPSARKPKKHHTVAKKQNQIFASFEKAIHALKNNYYQLNNALGLSATKASPQS